MFRLSPQCLRSRRFARRSDYSDATAQIPSVAPCCSETSRRAKTGRRETLTISSDVLFAHESLAAVVTKITAAHHVRAVDPVSHTIEIIESGTRKS